MGKKNLVYSSVNASQYISSITVVYYIAITYLLCLLYFDLNFTFYLN